MYDNLFFFTTPGYKVFAGNISYDVTKEELKEFFSDCGGEIKKKIYRCRHVKTETLPLLNAALKNCCQGKEDYGGDTDIIIQRNAINLDQLRRAYQ